MRAVLYSRAYSAGAEIEFFGCSPAHIFRLKNGQIDDILILITGMA